MSETDDVSVTMRYHEQAVVLFLGRGEVCIADDRSQPYPFPPVQRAVWVARLRAIADTLAIDPERAETGGTL